MEALSVHCLQGTQGTVFLKVNTGLLKLNTVYLEQGFLSAAGLIFGNGLQVDKLI